jgi:hypothetical protein
LRHQRRHRPRRLVRRRRIWTRAAAGLAAEADCPADPDW